MLFMLLFFFRIQRGIDFTDESWYVAEPYAVANGSVPYVTNITQASGFTIPLAFVYKLFLAINQSTEGIFYFARIFYFTWFIGMLIVNFELCKKVTNINIPFTIVIPLMLWCNYQLYSINYNSIGQIYLPTVILLSFLNIDDKKQKNQLKCGALIGVIAGRMIIGTPQTLIACICILVLLIANKKIARLLGIFVGVLIMAIIVIGYACACGGAKNFVNASYFFCRDFGYFKIKPEVSLSDNLTYLAKFIAPFLLCIFLCMICQLIYQKIKKTSIYKYTVLGILCVFLVYGLFCGYTNYTLLIKYSWFEAVIGSLFLENSVPKEKKCMNFKMVFICATYFSGYLVSSFLNVYGFGAREYWLLVPTVISYYFLYSQIKKYFVSRIIFDLGIVSLSFVLMCQAFNYVYRDDAMSQLNTRIENGVWKGLYTTELRAESIEDIEKYIRENTNKNDKVQFRDWASFGYLMSDGKICSLSNVIF